MSPSRGRPRSEYSLAAKLMPFDVGETLYLDSEEGVGAKSVQLERAITTLKLRQDPFKDREYRTKRLIAVGTHPMECRMILAITRLK